MVEAALAGAAEAVPMAAAAEAVEALLVAAALAAAAGEDAASEDAAVAAEVAEDADNRRKNKRSAVPYGTALLLWVREITEEANGCQNRRGAVPSA